MLGDLYLDSSSSPGATAARASLNLRWGSISGWGKKKKTFFRIKNGTVGSATIRRIERWYWFSPESIRVVRRS